LLRRIILLLAVATLVLAIIVPAYAAPQKPGVGKTINCKSGTVCQGTPYDDVIYGTEGNDNIRPDAGNDKVYARGGDDQVGHSGGNDTIEGGPGADTLRGGFGYDVIYDNTATASGDRAHDLLDCAYLATRGDRGPDVGYGEDTDTVVDCSNRDDQ
jgi:Ca2+-binding RTX toxin-like protein